MPIHNVSASELLREVIIAGVVPGLVEGLKTGFKTAGEGVGARVVKTLEEARSELLAFIQSLEAEDALASQTLIRRQQDRQFLRPRNYGENKPYRPGDENLYVQLLSKFYRALDKPEQAEIRKETFKWFGRLSDEEFDATIEFLHDDRAVQWLKRIGAGIGQVVNTIVNTTTINEITQRLRDSRRSQSWLRPRRVR